MNTKSSSTSVVIATTVIGVAALTTLPLMPAGLSIGSFAGFLFKSFVGRCCIAAGILWGWWGIYNSVPRRVPVTEPDVKGWKVFIGEGRRNKKIYHDFDEYAHLKAGGVTGAGKTKGLELILGQIVATKSADQVEVHIIDMKQGASFAHFECAEQVNGRIYSNVSEVCGALQTIHEEMEKRLLLIRKARSVFKPIPKFHRIIVMIDEGGELSPAYAYGKKDKEIRTMCLSYLSSLARVGRESRVSIVYSTQRPSNETLPTPIRGQMDATMGYRTQNELDSNILLRNENAASIPNIKGRMRYQTPDNEIEIQTGYIPDDVLQKWIESKSTFVRDEEIIEPEFEMKDEEDNEGDRRGQQPSLSLPANSDEWGV